MWTASVKHTYRRALLPLVAVLALLPHVGQGFWKTKPYQPAFFAHGLFKRCIARDETVMLLPYNDRGDSLLWQAEAGFGFRMTEGSVTAKWPDTYRARRPSPRSSSGSSRREAATPYLHSRSPSARRRS